MNSFMPLNAVSFIFSAATNLIPEEDTGMSLQGWIIPGAC